MTSRGPSNENVANVLERIADLLQVQQANRFRILAYRKAARSVRMASETVARLAQKNGDTLQDRLDGVGESLARVIEEFVSTGRSGLLERLEGEISPVDLFRRVPGIGEELARRIADELDIETFEELELAAHDGRLGQVEGFGKRRVKGVRETLAGMLSRSARRRTRGGDSGERSIPSVETILDVDAEYRRRAEADDLKNIAPRRFNPEGEAWLPILHTERGDWSFTALFSNTARAHEAGATRDWVVIYFDRDGEERQVTVVTESGGALAGKRVVRGREGECRRYYSAVDE